MSDCNISGGSGPSPLHPHSPINTAFAHSWSVAALYPHLQGFVQLFSFFRSVLFTFDPYSSVVRSFLFGCMRLCVAAESREVRGSEILLRRDPVPEVRYGTVAFRKRVVT